LSIGGKLKELRIKRNKSLQEVADAIGASKAHIWDLEKGNSKNPSMELLTKIADYFKISVAELVGEDPNALNEEPEMVALYRDLKKLNPRDRDTIKTLVEKFKSQKSGDG
jgi:transcriptional regulator with XRE-family HTH domain